MRFCPWYPVERAPTCAPAGATVLQVRMATGLRDYPTGKSAMVHYELANDGAAAARALAARWRGRELLCRHLEAESGTPDDPAAVHARVLGEFIRRFGAPPALS